MGFGGPSFFGTNLSLGQALYMAEQEGEDSLATTRKAHFNAALREMKEELSWARGTDYDASITVDRILMKHDIMPHTLTASEVSRIERAIA